MTNKHNYKYKRDRTLLQNTFGIHKSSFNKKKYKPGMHKSTRSYETFYGKLLNQRQKLKAFYVNLKNKQLKTLIRKSIKHLDYKKRITQNLETRIDTLLFRSGLVTSFNAARQMINHKHVKQNNIYIRSPSYKIVTKDPIEFSSNGQKIINNNNGKIGRSAPSYIYIKKDNNKTSVVIDTDNIPTKESLLRFATKISIDQVISSYRI